MMQEANRDEKAAEDGRKKVRRWTVEEHNKLQELVRAAGPHIKWPSIAEALDTGRTSKQCRERYLNARPENKKGSWTAEEEVLIAKLHAEMGPTWSRIARKLPGRNENDTKNHWNALLRCKTLDNRTDSVLGCYARLVRDGAQPCPATFEQACRDHEANTIPTTTPSPQPASSSDSPAHPHDNDDDVQLDELQACVMLLAQPPPTALQGQQRPTRMLMQPLPTPLVTQLQIAGTQTLNGGHLKSSGTLHGLQQQQMQPTTTKQISFQYATQHGQPQMQVQQQQQLPASPHLATHTTLQQQQQQQQAGGFNTSAAEVYRTSSSASSDPKEQQDEEPYFQSSCDSLEAALHKARHDAYLRLTRGCTATVNTSNTNTINNPITRRLATATTFGASLHNTFTQLHDGVQRRHGMPGGAYTEYSQPNSAHSSSTQLTHGMSEISHTQPIVLPSMGAMQNVNLPNMGSMANVGCMSPRAAAQRMGWTGAGLQQERGSGLTSAGMQEAGLQPVTGKLATTIARMQADMQAGSTYADRAQLSSSLGNTQPNRMQLHVQSGSTQAGGVSGWGCDEGMLNELEQNYPHHMAEGARRPALKRWFSDLNESATNTGQAHKLLRGSMPTAYMSTNTNVYLPDRLLSSCGPRPQNPPQQLSISGGGHVTPAPTPTAMVTPALQPANMLMGTGSLGSSQFTQAMSQLDINTGQNTGGLWGPWARNHSI